MFTIVQSLQETRAAGGPFVWQSTLNRVIDLATHHWPSMDSRIGEGPRVVDGALALSICLYIVACERGVEPTDLHRGDVSEFSNAAHGDYLRRVERRLAALGHPADDQRDPVAIVWRHLKSELGPPDDSPLKELAYEDSSFGCRFGSAFIDGLSGIMAPRWAIAL